MNIITKRFFIAGSLIVAIALSSSVFAQEQGSAPGGGSTANLVGGYGTDQLSGKTPTGMLRQTKDSAYNILIGGVIGQIFPSNATFIPVAGKGNMTLSEQAIFNMLTSTNPLQSMDQLLLGIPAPLSSTQAGVLNVNATAFPLQPSEIDDSVNSIDFSNFISPVQYSIFSGPTSNPSAIPGLPTTSSSPPANSNANALNFITLAAELFNTPPVLNISGFNQTQMLKLVGNTSAMQYLASVRAMVAQQSIAISNLYFLYSQRMPQSTVQLVTQGGIPQIAGIHSLYPTASPLSIMQYMATRRYLPGINGAPSWSETIQKIATPIEIMRQQAYTERDINYMLYQNYLIQERILATLSMMELGGVQSQQVTLNQLYQKAMGSAPFGSSQGS